MESDQPPGKALEVEPNEHKAPEKQHVRPLTGFMNNLHRRFSSRDKSHVHETAVAGAAALAIASLVVPSAEVANIHEHVERPHQTIELTDYEQTIANPEGFKAAYQDFEAILQGTISEKALPPTVTDEKLAKHFTAQIIVEQGKRTGTEYQYWLNGRDTSDKDADIIIQAMSPNDHTNGGISVKFTTDAEGKIVSSDKKVTIPTSEERKQAAGKVLDAAVNWTQTTESSDVAESTTQNVKINDHGKVEISKAEIPKSNDLTTVIPKIPGDLADASFVADLTEQAKLGVMYNEKSIEAYDIPFFKKAQEIAHSLKDKKLKADAINVIDEQIALDINTLAAEGQSLSSIEKLREVLSDKSKADKFLAGAAVRMIEFQLTSLGASPEDLANQIADETLREDVKKIIKGNSNEEERNKIIDQATEMSMAYEKNATTFATTTYEKAVTS